MRGGGDVSVQTRYRRPARIAEGTGLLVLVLAILVPVVPRAWAGGLRDVVDRVLRTVSFQQHWGMYAPHPQLRHTEMRVFAVWPDGRREPLEEAAAEGAAWGTTWLARKDRKAIWRYYANLSPGRPNRNRAWYLRMVCVREARRTGEIPAKVVMEQVTRGFAPPGAVRSGKLPLGRPRVRHVAEQPCNLRSVRRMIHADPFRTVSSEGS